MSKVYAYIFSILLVSKVCVAHEFISGEYIEGELAAVELQNARDQVLASDEFSAQTKQAALSFAATAFLWDSPKLSVCFWQTDQKMILDSIIEQAKLWMVGTNVKFDFGANTTRQCIDERSADIRITLKPLSRDYYSKADFPLVGWDWSEYGNLPSTVRAKVSMSLVNTPLYWSRGQLEEFNFVVAHEFGHALGLIHEHQLIDCTPFLASQETVMKVFGLKTEENYKIFLLQLVKIPASDKLLRPKQLADFDIYSIMVYNWPQLLWKPGSPCARPQNVQHPNANDLAAINYLYPSSGLPNSPGASLGIVTNKSFDLETSDAMQAPSQENGALIGVSPRLTDQLAAENSSAALQESSRRMLEETLRVYQDIESNNSQPPSNNVDRMKTEQAPGGMIKETRSRRIDNLLRAMDRARATSR